MPQNCAPGTYQASEGHSECEVCPIGSYCHEAQVTPVPCDAGSFRAGYGGKSPADCTPCSLGTYDGVSTGRASNCPACAAGSYCLTPLTMASCPVHTQSEAGSSSQLGCRCVAGYVCSYKKLISAIVTLNATSVSDFNANVNGVQTRFVTSVAAAAGVSTTQVTIVSVQVHASSGRRLLSSDDAIKIDVYTRIDGAKHLTDLPKHMSARRLLVHDHTWTAAHTVRPLLS